eukprot:scaffold4262_cov328-Prasinococcus_capsulatus_cf.AAC.4
MLVPLRLPVEKTCSYFAADALAVQNDAGDGMGGFVRHHEHRLLEKLLHHSAQASRSSVALNSPSCNGAQGGLSNMERHPVQFEDLRHLLQDGVLGLGQNAHQVLLV